MELQDDLIVIPDPIGDRYASFGFISWWDQVQVRDATVMVVGAGALGNEVLKGLALMGIGRLFIVDFDTIEMGNLSRSVLFRAADSGQRKAEVTARAIKALNPDVEVQAFHGDINHDLGLGVFRRMDAIVGCLDNREARLSINRFCWLLGKPWVDGGIEALLGYARVFWPGRGACYECTLTSRDYKLINLRRSCGLLARENLLRGKVPTTPTAAAIVGGVQTQEVLKLIHGMEVQAGVSFIFNGLTNDFYATRLPEKEGCLSHDRFDRIVELHGASRDTTTLNDLLAIAKEQIGEDARLYWGYDLAVSFHCRHCQAKETVLTPLYKLTEQAAICTVCGEPRLPEVMHEFAGQEKEIADQPLDSLGVPPLAILTAFDGDQMVGLELCGDADVFDFR